VARQARGTEQAGDPDNGGAASLGEPAGGGDGRGRAWFLPAEIPSCESTGAWSDELCRVTAAVFAISFFLTRLCHFLICFLLEYKMPHFILDQITEFKVQTPTCA
jgi:hypothetical protein